MPEDKNFWQEVGDFFRNAANKVASFFRRTRKWIRAHLDDIIDILEMVKKIIRSPLVVGFTKWTDFEWDDFTRKKLEKWIPYWVERLKLVDNVNECLDKPTIEEKMDCILAALQEVPKKYQNELFKNVAISMAKENFDSEGVKYEESELEASLEGAYRVKKMAEKTAGTDEK